MGISGRRGYRFLNVLVFEMSSKINTEYFRPSDAKAVVGVSRATIYKWKAQGLLNITKHGGMAFVSMREVRKIIDPLGDQLGDQSA